MREIFICDKIVICQNHAIFLSHEIRQKRCNIRSIITRCGAMIHKLDDDLTFITPNGCNDFKATCNDVALMIEEYEE